MERQISFTFPTPTDTPYRTPSSSLSRRTPDYEDRSPSSTPPPLPTELRIARKRSNDSQTALDENISPLDPRRFTPSLHASLVSEILSLRRDVESKTKSIDHLEQSLDSLRSQNDGLNKSLLTGNKEVRSVKRQMQLLEGGTISALGDLTKERDDAIQDAVELRKRVEQLQKRAKSHEDNVDRTHALWGLDKELWATEKRTLETKAHVAESRLKVVIDEVAQVQAQAQVHATKALPDDVAHRSESRSSVPGSPIAVSSPNLRRRRQSASSVNSDHNGGRNSALSFSYNHTINLADELALDDIEEDEVDEEDYGEGKVSPDALVEERTRPLSRSSNKARKMLGLALEFENPGDEAKPHSRQNMTELSTPSMERLAYVDSAVQYSPPPSPIQHATVDDGADTEIPSVIEMLSQISQRKSYSIPVMVSSSCQTVEHLPSPPLTPKQDENILATIHESGMEKAETKDISTQTDLRPRPGYSRYTHSRTSTHDLGIPTIAIIPPTSRPVTPEGNVVLPPHTKNASCQVEPLLLSNYTTSSMQTEEIRIDRRNIPVSPAPEEHTSSNSFNSSASKGKASVYTKKGSSQGLQPLSNWSSKRRASQNPPVAPPNDDGPLATESSLASSRPVRSSSLFAGFDDFAEVGDEVHDDIFYEDEHSSRPTAKFTLRSGKLISQESTLEDIGEATAVSAGEAVALDTLRRSEKTLPPELRQFDSLESSQDLQQQSMAKRASSGAKQANVRRSILISNGVNAHQSRLSQSTLESMSNDGSMPPPIPVPLRYSSARIGKAYSESGRNSRDSSNASPTKQYRQKYKPALRKTRSGPAISPASQIRRPRSRSPPFNSRVSIVPEMPHFEMPGQTPFDSLPPLTNDMMNASYETGAPRPQIATGPSRSYNHRTQISDQGLLQQTSVVEAIAQTMVGEWMYKYVRRRKSFGKADKDWDPNKSVEELTSNPSSAGVRHKRWVWVAPYERAIMWSSKQPMNGNALLGKSGRKLTVKSVLDVKDDNPMPKNSLTGPTFNRSILILTPQRALKFTATSQERHFVWLTALSFLSHSPLSIGDLAALPPPPDEYRSPTPPTSNVGGSFRRRTLRDSIRISKGPKKKENPPRSATDGSLRLEQLSHTRPSTRDVYEPEDNSAQPPFVGRFHTRNRSNTAPRPGANTFLSFNRGAAPSSSSSYPNNDTARQYTPSTGYHRRVGSETSAPGGFATHNNKNTSYAAQDVFSFTDSSHNASMTMRMDAFIDNKQSGKGGFRNLRLSGAPRATNKDPSYWGLDEPTTSTVSPVDSFTPGANTSIRLSDSTGRASVERDFYRGF